MTTPKVLVVTGGSRGIGAAIARMAGARGYDVAVNYKVNEAAAAEVVAGVTGAGRRAIAIQGDMANEADIKRMFATVDGKLGRLTHLVYNAGITGKASRVEDASTQTFREVIDTNVLGALLCAQEAVRRMSTRKGGAGGSIVMISSIAADLGGAGEYVWYAGTKGAVNSITIGLGKEVATDGIRVNAISPGLIDTEIHSPGRLERLMPNVPAARAGSADEVAEATLYLLSDAASYITSTILRVSGGR